MRKFCPNCEEGLKINAQNPGNRKLYSTSSPFVCV